MTISQIKDNLVEVYDVDSWAVVQVLMGEPVSSIGPFDSRIAAETYVEFARAHTEDGDFLGGMFVVPRISPQEL